MVDCVLYFEGDQHSSYRILRAAKNRFGATNEIGVFEMEDAGLHEVENPSEMLLAGRPADAPGTCVTCVMEGVRPVLAEIQALIAPSGYGTPRRTSNGFDYNRAAMHFTSGFTDLQKAISSPICFTEKLGRVAYPLERWMVMSFVRPLMAARMAS